MYTQAYSVTDFCKAHSISRAYLYLLLKTGRGPRLMKVGRRTLISAEAALEWRATMTAGSSTELGEQS
jgi:hypothetical protein